MLNFERPKHYAFKPTITVKVVPLEIAHMEEAYKKLQEIQIDYSLNDVPYVPSSNYYYSSSNASSTPVATSTRVYI